MIVSKHSNKFLTVLAAGWTVFLLVGAVQPEWLMLRIIPDKHLFGLVHVIAYGMFSFILCFYFRRFKSIGPFRLHTVYLILLVFLTTALCGCAAEVMQMFTPERIPDLADVRADLLGSSIAILSFFAIRALNRLRPRFAPVPAKSAA